MASNWVHSALRSPRGLLCQPRVIMMMEKLVEWLAGETEVLGENLPQCRFAHYKPHTLCPDENTGRRGEKLATNRLSYGTSRQFFTSLVIYIVRYFVSKRNLLSSRKEKVKPSLQPAVEAHRVVRRRDSHISRQSAQRWRWGCESKAPAALYPQGDSWYSFLLEAESTLGP
jgi:hypothetical protein